MTTAGKATALVKNPTSPPRKDMKIRRLEGAAGGRAELIEALRASEDDRALALANLLEDDAYQGHSFGVLCSRVGLAGREVARLYVRVKSDEALVYLARYLPELASEIAADALEGDKDCRKMVFDATGLIGRRGPLVAQQFPVVDQQRAMDDDIDQMERFQADRWSPGGRNREDDAQNEPHDQVGRNRRRLSLRGGAQQRYRHRRGRCAFSHDDQHRRLGAGGRGVEGDHHRTGGARTERGFAGIGSDGELRGVGAGERNAIGLERHIGGRSVGNRN